MNSENRSPPVGLAYINASVRLAFRLSQTGGQLLKTMKPAQGRRLVNDSL